MSDDAGRLTTASLLNGLREGDDGKWTRFVCAYGPIVVAWVRKAGIDAIEVEDLAQEIFIAASKGLENYRHES